MSLKDVGYFVTEGKIKRIEGAVEAALAEGYTPKEIITAMTEAMCRVGERFHHSNIFVPEMLVASIAMKKGVEVLKPLLVAGETLDRGKFIIGTVKGDLHDIGTNLVALMLEAHGFEVVNLGVDVSPGAFVAALRDNPDCHLLGLSVLLSSALEAVRTTITAVDAAGLREQVRILVGGAPMTRELAEIYGADAYASDAYEAAGTAIELA